METDGRTGFMGFLSLLFPVSPSLTDRPTADARTDGGPPKTRVESSCPSSPAASLRSLASSGGEKKFI